MSSRAIVRIARLPLIRWTAVALPPFRSFAYRHVAGESLDDAVAAARSLNAAGFLVTLNHLGTHVRAPHRVDEAVDTAIAAIAAIRDECLAADYSVKLTQLGLDFDRELCWRALIAIADAARAADVFLWVDIEEVRYVDATLAVFEDLRRRVGTERVGIAIQSYLRRTEEDLGRLLDAGSRIRLVKGGYWEVGGEFLDVAEVMPAFLRDIARVIADADSPAIATHNHLALRAIDHAAAAARRDLDAFEIQMLFGVGQREGARLVATGHRVRCYVPFGRDWYEFALGCLRQTIRGRLRRSRGEVIPVA